MVTRVTPPAGACQASETISQFFGSPSRFGRVATHKLSVPRNFVGWVLTMDEIEILGISVPPVAARSGSSLSRDSAVDPPSTAARVAAAERRGSVRGTSRRVALLIGAGALLLFAEAAAHFFGGPNVADLGAVFVAATCSSIAGFAFSAICGAFLFHLISKPVHVVQVMIVCSIAIQMLSVATLRNAIDWRHLARFLLGGALGLPLGVYLLTHLASSLYLKCIGVFLIAYGLYMLLRPPAAAIGSNRLGDYAVGFLGGVTGGFAGFPGAFVTIWCGLKGWSKRSAAWRLPALYTHNAGSGAGVDPNRGSIQCARCCDRFSDVVFCAGGVVGDVVRYRHIPQTDRPPVPPFR
jgi:uncharacterized membrane protein YfcA